MRSYGESMWLRNIKSSSINEQIKYFAIQFLYNYNRDFIEAVSPAILGSWKV